jgi:hypothetical protein
VICWRAFRMRGSSSHAHGGCSITWQTDVRGCSRMSSCPTSARCPAAMSASTRERDRDVGGPSAGCAMRGRARSS